MATESNHLEQLQIEPLPLTIASVDVEVEEFTNADAGAATPISSNGSSLSVHLITLGELRCIHDGVDTDLPNQKLRFALLVYLAMKRSAPREKILALLWPEVNEEKARRRLISNIFELNKVYKGCVESKGSELRVADHITIDARDFSYMADVGDVEPALELYHRPFLDGFYVDEAGEFERWVESNRSVLHGIYRHVARAGIPALIDRGNHTAAVAHAARWVDLDEGTEDAHRLLMTALMRAGRNSEALAHYQGLERTLREESGARPSEALKKLETQIRDDLSLPDRVHEYTNEPIDPPEYDVPPPPPPRKRWIKAVLLTLPPALMLFGLANDATYDTVLDLIVADAPLDSTRYAAMPFRYGNDVTPDLFEQQVINGVLSQLDGIALVDEFQLPDLGSDQKTMTLRKARRAAKKVGAGRFFFGSVVNMRGKFQLTVSLYKTTYRAELIASAIKTIRNPSSADTAIATAVDELILGPLANTKASWISGTRSVPARLDYARGQQAIKEWRLQAADSAFTRAIDNDPNFVEASLWLAQVRSWTRNEPSEWRISAEHASSERARLSWRDALLSEALMALARDDRPTACGLYQTIIRTDENDFPALYSLARCLERDRTVEPDPSSPSKWRFRSGYNTALEAYKAAFRKLPSAHRGLSADLFEGLRKALMTSEVTIRDGQSRGPSGKTFVAFAGLSDTDTIETVPYPVEMFNSGRKETVPPTIARAIDHQRKAFLEIARTWTSENGRSAEAYLALAVALDLMMDPTAADTLVRARNFTADPNLREYFAAVEVIIRIKSSLPDNLRGLHRAVELADSLLQERPPGKERHSEIMGAVAAITGRVSQAAAYFERASQTRSTKAQLIPVAPRMMVYSVFGQPTDSVNGLFQATRRRISLLADTLEKDLATAEWLIRASTLSFPLYHQALDATGKSGDYLYKAQQSFLAGDTASVRRGIREIAALRAPFSSAAATSDVVYPEASLLVDIGEPAAAAAWLDNYLNALPRVAPENLDDPIRTGALVRAIGLRVQIASQLGDSRNRDRWSAALNVLLSSVEPQIRHAFESTALKIGVPRRRR